MLSKREKRKKYVISLKLRPKAISLNQQNFLIISLVFTMEVNKCRYIKDETSPIIGLPSHHTVRKKTH